MLVMQGFSSYCWAGLTQSQSWFCSWHSLFQWGGGGCTRCLEGRQPGQTTSTDHQYIPDHRMLLSSKIQRGRLVRPHWALVSCWWAIVFFHIVKKKILDFIFPSLCLGFSLLFFSCLCLSYLYGFYFTHEVSSVLPFWFSPQHWGGVSEWVNHCMGFSCYLWLNHNNGLKKPMCYSSG